MMMMQNTAAQIEAAFRAELKAPMTRYDATLTVNRGRMHVMIDERDDGSMASHPEHEFELGSAIIPARLDGSDE